MSALIKRIDDKRLSEQEFEAAQDWLETNGTSGLAYLLREVRDCRAEIERLTLALKDSQAINLGFAQDRETTDSEIQRLEAMREYVPMTDDELTNLAKKWQVDTAECMNLGQPRLPLFHTYIEAEVIKRAGLRIKEEK